MRRLKRRSLLCSAIFAGLVLALPGWGAFAASTSTSSHATNNAETRTLSFIHTHTHETLTVQYWSNGVYDPHALVTINQFLRDFRTGESIDIDPELLDLLYELARSTGTRAPYQVISGYRSPETNAALQAAGHHVATHSQHMHGHAIDVRLADVSIEALRDAALHLGRGGVGYYPGDRFVHVDTGRVRSW